MERNTVSEGLLIRYNVRNGQLKPGFEQVTGSQYAMGTYTPRILRGSEFYIGPLTDAPRVVTAPRSAATESDLYIRGDNSRQRRMFVVESEEASANVEEGREDAAQTDTSGNPSQHLGVLKVLKPLHYLMGVFGLFYPPRGQLSKIPLTLLKIYGGFVIAVLWANVFRLLFCFDPDDGRKPGIVLKLTVFGWFVCSAVTTSESFWAWNADNFPRIFREWHKQWTNDKPLLKTRHCLKNFALCCAICGYVLTLAALGFGLYAMFGVSRFFVVDDVNLVTCPLHSGSAFLAFLFTFSLVFTSAAWILPLLHLLLISFTLCKDFQLFDRKLLAAIETDKNVHRYLEDFRQRHLSLLRLTHTVDKSFSFYSSATFVINFVTIIALLGHLCLNPHSAIEVTVPSGIFLAMSIFTLSIFLGACVLITSSSQIPLNTILRYRVFSGSSENSIQISLFLHQLTQLPVGLTVLGLFNVNNRTLLLCLSVLAVYLSILVHILPHDAVAVNNSMNGNRTNASLVT